MAGLESRSVVVGAFLLGGGILFGRGISGAGFSTDGHLAFSPGEVEQATIGLSAFTSPFLECAGERDYEPNLRRSRIRILDALEAHQATDPTLRVSVYARDLLNGPWMGIDEGAPFHPASLMKVPVLFHALARLDNDPGLRTRRLTYPGPEAMQSPDNLTHQPAEERMVPGQSYSFTELLERMITFSDNHAKDMVLEGVDPDAVDEFMGMIGVPSLEEGGQPIMDARAYGSLFRILFNSTLFSRPTSEMALAMLARSRYPDGFRAGLPQDLTVASKYGIHRDPTHPEDGTQLHECGIVYAARGPYVLCVMTASREKTVGDLAEILAEVSRLVYEQAGN